MLGEKGSEDPLGTALDPLGADVSLDVTPMTTSLYGFVRDQAGFGLKAVPVEVNGQTVTTDDLGRYIAPGVAAAAGKKINVSIARAGYPTKKESTAFVANMPTQLDITLSGANNTVAITGTVTESGTGTPLKGVEIKVDGKAPLNAPQNKTGDDGTYTVLVATQPNNDPLVTVSPSKAGYHFVPASSPVAAIAGANPSANFTGYEATEIVGSVTAPGGGMPRAEVTVTAYSDAGRTTAIRGASVTTTETGTFSVKVPTLSGTVYLGAAPRDDYDPSHPNFHNLRDSERYTWFDEPANRPGGQIAVIPGQILQFGTFTGHSVQPRITSVSRVNLRAASESEADPASAIVPAIADRQGTAGFELVQGEPTDTIFVTWHYETRNNTGTDLDPGGTDANPYTAVDAADNGALTTALGPRFTSFSAPGTGVTTPVSAIRGTRSGANRRRHRCPRRGTAGRGTAGANTTVRHDRVTQVHHS